MALVVVEHLSFAYPAAVPGLRDISLRLNAGERVALLGPSGSGKSTLLRALSGLVPHFHGGRFEGQVVVAGLDTRRARPAEMAGTVATVFQDPEDQVVMTLAMNEVAFGLENIGVEPRAIWPRVERALEAVGASHLAERRTAELSGGELQRVCLAAALALEPQLLLLDEPTSQLDPDGAAAFFDAVDALGATIVLSEQRVGRALAHADRVLFLEHGRLLLDAPRAEAEEWLGEHRPRYVDSATEPAIVVAEEPSESPLLLDLDDVAFAYQGGPPVVDGVDLELRRGEVVALEGANGSGKTTLAKLASGLLEPSRGSVRRHGRVAYLSQDPGRYLAKETVLAEVALGVGGDEARARAALDRFGLSFAHDRHPRDLSSGERERLGVAAVAVSEPDVLVLDEPTRGLDPDRKAELTAWLTAYAAAGRAVLLATHDRSFVAHRTIRVGAVEEVRAGR